LRSKAQQRGLVYSVLSERLACLPAAYDSQMAAFTFAQVVKPFELYSAKQLVASSYTYIPSSQFGCWLTLTAIHSVLSLALVALFLLAIRWRFRRE
jgi:hypothetical protein